MIAHNTMRRWTANVALLVVVLWLAYVIYGGVQARSAALDGRDRIESITEDLDPARMLRGELDEDLAAASAHFGEAADRLGGVAFWPVRRLPWIGTQVESVQALSESARTSLELGLELTTHSAPLMEGLDSGEIDERSAIRQLAPVLADLHQRSLDLDFGPDEGLIGALEELRDDFSSRADDLVDGLGRSAAAADGIASFLDGPGTYLLFAANNSEMAAGSGRPLSMGTMTVVDGRISVGAIQSIGRVDLPPEPVEVDPEVAALWADLGPGGRWVDLVLSPRFDVTARTALAMWEAIGNEPVDGVIFVDPVALSSVVDAVGGLTIFGEEFSGDELLLELLHDQYIEIDRALYDEGLDFSATQGARRDRLASIAASVLTTVTGPDVDQIEILLGLASAARGRHLMLYSNDTAQQRAWRAAGLSGELSADSVAVSSANRGLSKLDHFIDVSGEIEVVSFADRHEVQLTIVVSNRVPPGESDYVAGARPELGLEYGDYLGALSVNVPGAATDIRFDDQMSPPISGPDGPTMVVGSFVTVPRGTSSVHVVRFDLPPSMTSLTLEPSARVPEVVWTHGRIELLDDAPRTVEWPPYQAPESVTDSLEPGG